ncbi:MAG: protein translocase subunit SecF [Clostridia bacterium]|nr:protein translocase subunit SecF [Clostridia bacterium]
MKKSAKLCLLLSCAVMAAALVLSLAGRGVNLGIDFAGGLSIKYDMGQSVNKQDIETALNNQGITGAVLTLMGDAQEEVQLRVPEISDEGVQTLRASLEAELLVKYPQMDVGNASVSYVGPVAGATLVKNAFMSVIIASVLMLIYIAVRFDFASGIASVLGLIHDVLIMLSFMVILRDVIQMNSSFIAAMLTIVGYSINNTIVIFDRIRENVRRHLGSLSRQQIVQKSVKESRGRTLLTTLTTLVTIETLYLLGVASIKEFALPIIIGILSGVYSANLINGYIWAAIEDWRKTRKVKA